MTSLVNDKPLFTVNGTCQNLRTQTRPVKSISKLLYLCFCSEVFVREWKKSERYEVRMKIFSISIPGFEQANKMVHSAVNSIFNILMNSHIYQPSRLTNTILQKLWITIPWLPSVYAGWYIYISIKLKLITTCTQEKNESIITKLNYWFHGYSFLISTNHH